MRNGVSASRHRADFTAWGKWNQHCAYLGVSPDLSDVADPIPILQIFAHRVRSGVLAAKGGSIKKRSVEQYLRSVGQIFASVGASDPRMDAVGNIDFRLRRQLAKYQNDDPAPTRVRPIPLTLLLHLHKRATIRGEIQQHIADLALLAFFFLLHPGEYCKGGPDNRSAPFRIRDVTFFVGPRRYNAATAPDHILDAADFVSLTFNDQKNGIKGEAMGHGTTEHPVADPVRIAARLIRRLRRGNATADTAISATRNSNTTWRTITSVQITAALRLATKDIGDELGFRPEDISTRAMRAGGAMALLLGDVDYDKIKLLGRWRSDAMMVYLHTSARPLMQNFANVMVNHGDYAQIPADIAGEATGEA